ncbi:MAG: isoprenylcysteine carboxylmethyltransferase family protein [Ignavibacteriae bacterium]|nr:isoprenylcysteine carboxylmethyltransferase family protein [Ignavibacteriota bacterium]
MKPLSQSIEIERTRSVTDVNPAMLMFRYRGLTPLPFLAVMIAFAQPTLTSLLLGSLVVLCGEGLRMWGVLAAGGETRTTGEFICRSLVTHGPFAFVRNPLYIGNIMIYMGFGIMSLALHPWLMVVAVIWFCVQYTIIIVNEEKFLRRRFGNQYEEYCTNVHRFIPRLTAFVPGSNISERKKRNGIGSERRTLQAIGIVTFMVVLVYAL